MIDLVLSLASSLCALLRCRHAWAGLFVSLAALTTSPVRADVWGYVDNNGVAHFSAVRVDDRYELFLRGDHAFAAGEGEFSPADTTSKQVAAYVGSQDNSIGNVSAPQKLLAYFDVSPSYKAVKHLLREASLLHGIDYELLQALIATESGFNTNALSPRGAVGLMQLIPPTAQRYGVRAGKDMSIEKKLTDPRTNIKAGAHYLSDLITMFPGQLDLAIAAYNAGEGAVQRAGNRIPNYPETRNYVKTVMQLYEHLKPAAIVQARSSGRVRMEMMGGSPSIEKLPKQATSLRAAGLQGIESPNPAVLPNAFELP